MNLPNTRGGNGSRFGFGALNTVRVNSPTDPTDRRSQVLLLTAADGLGQGEQVDFYTSLPYSKVRVIAEIVSLPGYEAQVSALMDEDERSAMEFFIACAPEEHPVIPGAGGFRKVRWARRGRGKSAGFRIIYYFVAEPGRIYMASIYAKSQKENLSATDRNLLSKLAAQIKAAVKGGKSS